MQFVLFAISTAGSISFSSYMILANDPDNRTPDAWVIRGVAITALTGVCLIHAFTPRLGIWLSNGLGAFKLVLLSLVVFTGFAALAGRMEKPSPGNFKSFHGEGTLRDDKGNSPAGAAAGYALALLQVLYAYSGWENANYVLTEVRNAPTTLKRAAPIAISIVTVLYVLANIAYVSWFSRMEVEVRGAWLILCLVCGHEQKGNVRVGSRGGGGLLPKCKSPKPIPGSVSTNTTNQVMGKTTFVTKALPVFVGMSALGNVFAQSFAMPRVKQELAKEGVLPFSRFWASDWPFNAPSGAIFLHWLVTTALILGSQIGSQSGSAASAVSQISTVYTFVTNVFIYTGNWIKRESSLRMYPWPGCGADATQFSWPSGCSTSTSRRRSGGPSSARRSAARRC